MDVGGRATQDAEAGVQVLIKAASGRFFLPLLPWREKVGMRGIFVRLSLVNGRGDSQSLFPLRSQERVVKHHFPRFQKRSAGKAQSSDAGIP